MTDYWEIKVPKDMTIEKALAECKKQFPVWQWRDENLDKIVKSDRTATKAYSVWVRATVEADERHEDKSANELKEEGVVGITLLERLLLELDYFKKNNQHLDVENITLCSGSRSDDGRVPGVLWFSDDQQLVVDWFYPGYSLDCLRCREVFISKPSTPSFVPLSIEIDSRDVVTKHTWEVTLERVEKQLERLNKNLEKSFE